MNIWNKKNGKKAYLLYSQFYEYKYVVFAQSENKAKALISFNYKPGTEFFNLQAQRLPEADFFLLGDPKIERLHWHNLEHQKWLRINLGWKSYNGNDIYACFSCSNKRNCHPICNICNKDCRSWCVYDYNTDICKNYKEV